MRRRLTRADLLHLAVPLGCVTFLGALFAALPVLFQVIWGAVIAVFLGVRIWTASSIPDAVPDPSSDTAAGLPLSLSRSGFAGGGRAPIAAGEHLLNERAGDGQAQRLGCEVESFPVHSGGDTL